MKKQILIVALKYGLGLGLLGWVVCSYWSRTEKGQEVGLVGVLDRPVELKFLVFAALVSISCLLLTFVRWFILVRAQDIPFSLPSALRLGLVGYYYSTFLPGSVGGDIIKAACIAWEQSRRTVAVATVIVDRIVGLCGLFWLTALAGGIFWACGAVEKIAQGGEAAAVLETIVLGAISLSAGSLVFWIVLGLLSDRRSIAIAVALRRVPKIGPTLGELWLAGWLYRCRGRAIALTLGMSIVSHAGFVLTFYLAARGLSLEMPSFATHYLIIPVGALIKGLFPAPGGVGGGEYGYGSLYELIGFPFAAGVLGSLGQRAIEWAIGLTGYLLYLRMRPSTPQPRQDASGIDIDRRV